MSSCQGFRSWIPPSVTASKASGPRVCRSATCCRSCLKWTVSGTGPSRRGAVRRSTRACVSSTRTRGSGCDPSRRRRRTRRLPCCLAARTSWGTSIIRVTSAITSSRPRSAMACMSSACSTRSTTSATSSTTPKPSRNAAVTSKAPSPTRCRPCTRWTASSTTVRSSRISVPTPSASRTWPVC